MEKEKRNHRQEYLRKMKENKDLLDQIDELKKQLKKVGQAGKIMDTLLIKHCSLNLHR